ncbi:hypothetical protein BD410DRAFT_786434 [Rickenella mellea]|uniref:Mitochondrial carrier n=1 Tax=Rickenella mellea TaxID=50990 RepID=A0A4Y7QBS8_9AGAM|nr:hypothetical protein BD410DRAFT_786434 [Rickenella mellea]
MGAIMSMIILGASLALTLLIAVPLAGTLVRFRANYNPKGLQLDSEGGAEPHTGPVVTSFFAMMGRVKRLEGWAGLYKGFMPTFLTTAVLMAFVTSITGSSASNSRGHNKYSTPYASPLAIALYSLFMLAISLPVIVITNRAITTPRKLPWLNPIYSLRVLLTETERRRPWMLFLTPGLFASEALHILYIVLILHTTRRFLFPSWSKLRTGDEVPADFTLPRMSIWLAVAMLSTIILCPLEVISTRLSIQRNHSAAGFNALSQDAELPSDENVEYSGAGEDVIGLRAEDDPYAGLVDCGKRIIGEEGYRTLYRAWWLTLLGVLFGGL